MRANFAPPRIKTAEELLLAFERSGDHSSFEEIVRRYSAMVYGVCYRVTRNAHDAEDSTQAVFLKLAVQARTTNGVPRVGSWLQQVAKTTAMDLRRSRTRRSTREQACAAIIQQQSPSVDATDELGMNELKQLLRAEVDQLPPSYRMPLILYYFGGLTTEQIARELNSNAKALGVRLFRGRKMLAGRLKSRGVNLPGGGGAMMRMALAGAILSALADSVWARPAGGGAVALSLMPRSALASAIAARVMEVMRACSALPRATRWMLSILLLLTMSSAMAGSSPLSRNSDAAKAVGGWLERLNDAFDGFGIRKLLRGWSMSPTEPPNGVEQAGQSVRVVAAAAAPAPVLTASGAKPSLSYPGIAPAVARSGPSPYPYSSAFLSSHARSLSSASTSGSSAVPATRGRDGQTASAAETSATKSLLAWGSSSRVTAFRATSAGGDALPARGSETAALIGSTLGPPSLAARAPSVITGPEQPPGPISIAAPPPMLPPMSPDVGGTVDPTLAISAPGSPWLPSPEGQTPPFISIGAELPADVRTAPSVPATGIPEPSGLGLIAGAFALLAKRRRSSRKSA